MKKENLKMNREKLTDRSNEVGFDALVIRRNGKEYKVLEQIGSSIKVEEYFNFADKPKRRKLYLWWDLEDCEIIKAV